MAKQYKAGMHQNYMHYAWDEVDCENSTSEFTSTLENTTGT
jgi:hypothetical protein